MRFYEQMGSNMKPTIFNERVAKALRNWHQSARKQIKKNHHSGSVTPLSSRPSTPLHGSSPVHLLRYFNNELDLSGPVSQRQGYRTESWQSGENDFSPSSDRSTTAKNQERPNPSISTDKNYCHEINIADFSFDKSSSGT